ncbi:MAG: RNA polymerase sigma factor [Bifidobacteriaceae bacterium]|jgi:RNA polymerase sigma-70 factor (ECF subfamily)|nr:RNA polymerase sigma factor [Bifidobacteriaceae bacterium]
MAATSSTALDVRFAQLYSETYAAIVAYFMRRVSVRSEVEDLAAEVYRIAWERLCRGADQAIMTLPWLYGVSHNVLRAHYRADEHHVELARRTAGEARRAEAVDGAAKALGEQVSQALSLVGPQHREVLMLHYWEELSAGEIAEVLGSSAGAVWVRLHRARAALREVMEAGMGVWA